MEKNGDKIIIDSVKTSADNSVSGAEAPEKFLEEMFKAGVHFGYSRTRRHPKMQPYIFGIRNNVEIFDIEKTKAKLDEAKDFLKSLGKNNKTVLFVGTKPGINQIVESSAQKLEMPYVSSRWIGGTLTNFKIVRGRVSYLEDLIAQKAAGEFEKYTKKEQLHLEEEIRKLDHNFSGLKRLKELPAAIFIIDPKEEKTAFREAKQIEIPIIAVANVDCDPEGINYLIPANDASLSSAAYLINEVAAAYQKGLEEKK